MFNIIERVDKEISDILRHELNRQESQIELIASENFVSRAVLEAQGSVLTNKYAEGYPHRRYYDGCEFVDMVEDVAIARAHQLFKCQYANVQPHSGSQANQAVFFALLKPGDTILSAALSAGGHLTHGAKPSLSGRWFKSISYHVCRDTFLIDYDEVERLALEHKPNIIITGYSAYSRQIDFARFSHIAKKVGAYLMADIAHIAGLVATGLHPSPIEFADVITSTTHKTLRGPRGGLILTNNQDMAKLIDAAVFPGIQGGPLMHVIAAKAVAFKENLEPAFAKYIDQVIKNAQELSDVLIGRGYNILTGGTDNHMLLVDLRSKGVHGSVASSALHNVGITCNKNAIPFDETSPALTSGIRLGSAACTTRGFGATEFRTVGHLIADILDHLSGDAKEVIRSTKESVINLCTKFPVYT